MCPDRSEVFRFLMKQLDIVEVMVKEDPLPVEEQEELTKYQARFAQVISVTGKANIFMTQNEEHGGDHFENISHSTIVNRSIVQKSFNKLARDYDDDTAQALQQLAEEIEKSGNREAAETFEAFNEELQKPEPKKSILRSLFNGITEALPALSSMTDLIEKISKIFT